MTEGTAKSLEWGRASVHERPAPESVARFYSGIRPYRHPILPAEELREGTPVEVELLGERIVLARLSGHLVAMEDFCRHYQAPLFYEGSQVQ